MTNNFFDFTLVNKNQLRLEEHLDYVPRMLAARSTSQYYPQYHIAPPHGLLNDPNGLMQLEGEYHLFHQWFPLGPVHGLKYWRYLTTRDFLTYRDHAIGIAPQDEQDCKGCFSGMAFLGSGQPQIFYTGLDSNAQQNVLQADFADYRISNKRLIVSLDPQLTTNNFRDPFVFSAQGKDYMLVGGENLNHQGVLCTYVRQADNTWKYLGNLELPCQDTGFMLECPNYLRIQEQDILIMSPQGLQRTEPHKFCNVFSVAYLVGTLHPEIPSFTGTDFIELDHGFDFYAPQVFVDQAGRTILYGWLGNSKAVYPSDHEQWAHMLTIPRQLSLCDQLLRQEPLAELRQLRSNSYLVQGKHSIKSTAFELEGQATEGLSITLGNAQGENLTFQVKDGTYYLDRSHNTHLYNQQYGQERQAPVLRPNSQLQIFVDASAIEIFADDGLTVFTARFYVDNLEFVDIQSASMKLHYLRAIEIIPA